MKNFKIKTTAILALIVFWASCSSNSSSDNSTSVSKPTISPTTSPTNSPETNSPATTNSPYSSGNSRSSVTEKDPYEIMHVAFEGSPSISTIKPMIEAIMDRHDMVKTNENILKVGNMLVSLRQTSPVGITELELLKHIYKHGSARISLAQQAGLSATILESN